MHKLALRINARLVEHAKKYAADHGKSLSQLVADYFNALLEESDVSKKLPPLTQSLRGIMAGSEVSSEEDYKKYLEDKYLLTSPGSLLNQPD
ncbi:DUF6364 family protein [Endozoicomonas sp. 4G]|uniref:DUF6364 family protein n=1 Tax=Endozoicomonas sp. 4G TaxID=2872754 RepID=UPI002078CD1E|nr:DUF6364 family protein [Endozoicomonas sp. 4G]